MPRYELSLIAKLLQRPEKIASMTEICTNLMKRGMNIRKVETLGDRPLPHTVSKQQVKHTEGTYFIMDVDLALQELPEQEKYLKKHSDVLTYNLFTHESIYKQEEPCAGKQEIDWDKKLRGSLRKHKNRPVVMSSLNLHDQI